MQRRTCNQEPSGSMMSATQEASLLFLRHAIQEAFVGCAAWRSASKVESGMTALVGAVIFGKCCP